MQFNQRQVYDQQLTRLCSSLPTLSYLNIRAWKITAVGMWTLTRLLNLKVLNLEECYVPEFEAFELFCDGMRSIGIKVDTKDI